MNKKIYFLILLVNLGIYGVVLFVMVEEKIDSVVFINEDIIVVIVVQ